MYFLDNASSTRCSKQSAEIVKNALINDFYNPSAKYKPAVDIYSKLNECRDAIKETLGAINYDVIFTSGATEANNLAFNSACGKSYKTLISVGEHSSVYETAKQLKQKGFDIEEVGLNENGEIDFKNFKEVMTNKVGFVSLMLVSNETGAINNIAQLVEFAKSINPNVLFHVDAVQGYCKLPINLEAIGADYMTISSHKIHGPKGVGALIVKKRTKIVQQIIGGGQENGNRSGTENYPAVLGFVNSAREMAENLRERFEQIKTLKFNFYSKLKEKAENNKLELVLNGDMENSSPYILSFSFPGVKAEILLHSLAEHEIYVGTGSACNSKHKSNRTLSAMGKSDATVEGNIRVSFGEECLAYDLEYITDKFIECVNNIKRK